MAVRDGALAPAGRNHGYVRRLGQLDEGFLCVGPRHSAAGVYQGQPGLGDDTGGLPEVFPAWHDSRDAGRVAQRDFLLLHTGIGGNLDQNGAGPAGPHLPERFEHGIRDLPGPERHPLPLGHRPHRARLVRDFVNGPDALSDCGARDLARNEEHGRGAGVRVGQAGRGIVKARSRDHERHPRFPRCPSITVGHVGRGLLVPGGDHADTRLVPQRGDDPVHLYARDPEYDLDALPYERLDQGFAATHLAQGSPPSFCRDGAISLTRTRDISGRRIVSPVLSLEL